jgi:hypothetical protein
MMTCPERLSVPFLVGFFALHLAFPAGGEPTKIYGVNGAGWQSAGGPLPDFSYAGYQRGEKPLPVLTPDVSVKDYGAVGDGVADDTAAIQKAIDENRGKTIRLPEGRYRISDIITIKYSGTVLQGEGPDKTVLVAPVPLQEIHPLAITYPDTGGTPYAYSGGFIAVTGSSRYFADEAHPVTQPAARGAVKVELAAGHPFKAGDEIVIIANETPGQTLLRYLYRDDASDISKAGSERSFRHVTRVTAVEGGVLTVERPLRIELRAEWRPEVHRFQPRVQEVGIEHLAFEFPEDPYLGHFTEKGFNAIHMNGVVHSWVRNVHIRNADSGILVRISVFTTVSEVVIESKRRASNPLGATGHHGISISSLDCLCTGFDFRTRFIHELTVSNDSVGNVFSNGKGVDMALDHHKLAPYENLFSNIDLGEGGRTFMSGGRASIGRHAGAGNTYWNLASKSQVEVPDGFGPTRLNFIGLKMRSQGGLDAEGRWVEAIRPGAVEPPDLHAAQLARRLGGAAPASAVPDRTLVHAWTNLEGKVVSARFGGLEANHVLLIPVGSPSVRYPLEKLSPDSQALARRLADAAR